LPQQRALLRDTARIKRALNATEQKLKSESEAAEGHLKKAEEARAAAENSKDAAETANQATQSKLLDTQKAATAAETLSQTVSTYQKNFDSFATALEQREKEFREGTATFNKMMEDNGKSGTEPAAVSLSLKRRRH
jgi:chromosome segregation ATPase